jgi:N-acetylglucosamine-6-sulfatase
VRTSLRQTSLLVVTVTVVAACVGGDGPPPPPRDAEGRLPPSIILVVADDQSIGSLSGEPTAMPWLLSRVRAPGWTTFTNAVVSTPMCCPSRASILTGRYAGGTGVETNTDGDLLDERTTLAVALHDAGYRTAMIGKYLNGYPWDRDPYVPEGWDRWFAKRNIVQETTYYGYEVIDDGRVETVGDGPEDYATDRLTAEALRFVRDAPDDRPYFLYLAPSAPHYPWEPAPRHQGLLGGFASPSPSFDELLAMNDVEGKPAWVQALAPVGETRAATLAWDRARERATLRALDDGIRALWEAVEARGEADRTVVVVTSDHGFAYGEHRWVGKGCPWEPCLAVPLFVFVPGTEGGTTDALVANIDLAPTIAALAGIPGPDADGVDLSGLLRGASAPDRRGVLIEWAGGLGVPAWRGVRTRDAVYVLHDDGTRELYDLAADPSQLRNLAGDPDVAPLERRLEALTGSLAGVEHRS